MLDGGREGDQLEVEGEVELWRARERASVVSFCYPVACLLADGWRTELTRSAREMVCCARVMVFDSEGWKSGRKMTAVGCCSVGVSQLDRWHWVVILLL